MAGNPVDRIVIQRLDHKGISTGTVVFTIPSSFAEHNIMMATLEKIKRDYPGAWYSFLSKEAQERQLATVREQERKDKDAKEKASRVGKVKEVTAAHLGLDEEAFKDIPV